MSPPDDATLDACEREIRELHAFFVEWYAGSVDRDAFERVERALASGFEMVAPEGSVRDRAAVLAAIHGEYGAREGFDIEIRAVAPAVTGPEPSVRYEEWQTGADGRTGRVSTARFRADPDAPAGVVWVDLHETWLDDG